MKLISSENLNAKLLRTEINIIDSFSTGLNIDKHIDELEVLLEIEEERRFYYPSIMSLKKEVELRLMLTEVLRIGREYDLAYKQINKLKLIVDRSLDSKYLLYTEYQEILLDIRTKKTNNNPKKIVKVIDSLRKTNEREMIAMANYLGALRLYGISGLETATINSLDSVIEELYLAKDYSTLLKASVMREGLSNNDSFSLFDEVWEVSSMKNNNLHRISLGLGRAEKIITIAEQQKNNGQEIDIEKVKVQVGKNLSYAEGQLDKLSSNNLKAYYYLNKSRMLLLQEKSFEETDELKIYYQTVLDQIITF